MPSTLAARRLSSFPVATLLIRGSALGGIFALPVSIGLGPFFVFGLGPLAVVGAAAGLGSAVAVGVLLYANHRLVTTHVRRGRLALAVSGALGAAAASVVLLLLWNGPPSAEWDKTYVQFWAAPVILGAGLITAMNRSAIIRVIASNDTAVRPVRFARWAVVGGQLFLTAAFARYFVIWLAEFQAEIAEEPSRFDHGAVVALTIPALALLVAGAVALLWPAPAEARAREDASAVIAVGGVVVSTLLLMFVAGANV
jgi:hypothetical protein